MNYFLTRVGSNFTPKTFQYGGKLSSLPGGMGPIWGSHCAEKRKFDQIVEKFLEVYVNIIKSTHIH